MLRLCGVTSEAHLPFGALQQAIGAILKQADTLPARQRSALHAAFGLSDDATVPDIFLVGLATLTLLTASAARKPILLVADDVHWLDPPSRDVLAFVARRLSSDPVVLLMAIRSDAEDNFRIRTSRAIACRGSPPPRRNACWTRRRPICRPICGGAFWTRPPAIPWRWSSCRAASAGRRPPTRIGFP